MKILTYNILSPELASWSNYKNHKAGSDIDIIGPNAFGPIIMFS